MNGSSEGGQGLHRKLSDVLAVQDEISEEISKALEFQLTREERNRLTKALHEQQRGLSPLPEGSLSLE